MRDAAGFHGEKLLSVIIEMWGIRGEIFVLPR